MRATSRAWRGHVGALPVEHDRPAVEPHAAVRVRQVLAHQVPVDAVACEPGEGRAGRPAQVGLEDRACDLAEELDVAERRAAAPVVEVEIVDAQRLLVDGIVPQARIDDQHGGAVVVHEVPADDARPVGDTLGAGLGRRAQQEGRRVHRTGGDDDGCGAELAPLAALQELDALDALSVRGDDQALDLGTGDQRDVGALQRPGQGCGLGVVLPAARVRVGVPGRGRALQPALDVDRERQGERMHALGREPGADRGDRRLVRHRRVRVGRGVPAARSGPRRRHPGPRTALRPWRTRARGCRRRRARPARRRRRAPAPRSPGHGSGTSPRRRTSSCRRRSSSCRG